MSDASPPNPSGRAPENPFASPNADLAGARSPAEDLELLWFEHVARRDRIRTWVFVSYVFVATIGMVPAYWLCAWIQVERYGGYLVKGTAVAAGVVSLALAVLGWVATRFVALKSLEHVRLTEFCEKAGVSMADVGRLERAR